MTRPCLHHPVIWLSTSSNEAAAATILADERADSGYGSDAASGTSHEEPSHKLVGVTWLDEHADCHVIHVSGVSSAGS